jgi:MAP kinase interacting serine/threonine kinase
MSLNTNENMLQERHLMAEDGSSKIQRKKKRQRAVESGMKKFCDLYESTDEYLGEGGCGQVRTYRNISSKKEFAVKVIQKTSCHIRCKVLREIEILHHCRGQKNIVQLIEFFEEDDRYTF